MPLISCTVIINAPILRVIEMSNDVGNWPKMMSEYKDAEVIERVGQKIWFRLTHMNGSKWVSWRMVHECGCFALAERYSPRAPFKYMQHLWTYKELPEVKTEMRWRMNFALPDNNQWKEQDLCDYLSQHATQNQDSMKEYIERRCNVLEENGGGSHA
jgi:ribosome-associated toxin RatA of RatAB toxin-antitoxin module